MCTMTWFTDEDGYELFFNRDERISRSRAELPSLQSSHIESSDANAGRDVHYISPTDADAGGTWIAVNEFGVTVCLLNHYQFEQIATYKNWVSRGEIVRKFAITHNLVMAEHVFNGMDLQDYRAFRMFMIDQQGNNRLCIWDGHSARIEVNVATPKSSSSVDAKHVKKVRKDLFRNLNLINSKDSNAYINYHASHLPSRSKESVCMHREDANTVSLSHVKVSSEGVSFAYADGAPCEASLGEPINLAFVESTIDDLEVAHSKALKIAAAR